MKTICYLPNVTVAVKWKPCMHVCCRVSVDAGITTDVAGNRNLAAAQVLKFRPPSSAVSAVSKAGNAIIAGSIAASLGTSLLAGVLPLLSVWPICCCALEL